MAKGARKTTATPMPQLEFAEQLERIAAFNGAALDMLTRMGEAYVKSMTALNEEMMKFMAQRLQHDAELGQSLGKCEDWTAAADLQRDWVREASEEYFAEAGKLLELASKVTTESWEPVRERAAKALDDLQTTAQ